MKFMSAMLAFCLLLCAAAPAVAACPNPTSEVQLTVTRVAEKTIDLTLTNLQQQRTTVTIQSLDGTVIYFQENVKKHNGYHKRLNLKDLPNGKYLLTIQQGREKRRQVIVIKPELGMLLSTIR
jgi:hypothetical protein